MELQTEGTWTPQARMMSVPHCTPRREPVVFGHALELLMADIGRLGRQALDALAGLGLPPRAPVQVAYPGAVWVGAIQILSSALYPYLPIHKAEFLLGRRFMEHALQSRMGAAMNAHARVVGPERTLLRLSYNLRMLNNFIGASVRELPGRVGWELVMRPLPEFLVLAEAHGDPPHFTRGVFTTAFRAAGVSSFQMDVVCHDDVLGSSIFHIAF